MDNETKNNIKGLHVFLLWAKYYRKHLPKSQYKKWYSDLRGDSKEHVDIHYEAEKEFQKELKEFKNS